MQTLNKLSRICAQLMALLFIGPILVACSTAPTRPPLNTGPARTDEALACSELPPLVFQPGAPNASPDLVISQMKAHPEDPLAYARGILGDTMSTRTAVAQNRARRVALGCKFP